MRCRVTSCGQILLGTLSEQTYAVCRIGGPGRIRTYVGISRQIYSLLPLAAWVPTHDAQHTTEPSLNHHVRKTTPRCLLTYRLTIEDFETRHLFGERVLELFASLQLRNRCHDLPTA